MTLFLIVGFALIWLPDLPGMMRRKHAGEIMVFALLWAVGLTLSLLILYDVKVDYITLALRAIFEPIGKAIIKPPPI